MTREELARDVLLALIARDEDEMHGGPRTAVSIADELLAALAPPAPQPAPSPEGDRAARVLAAADEFKRRRQIYDEAEKECQDNGQRYRGSKHIEALWHWVCQAASMLETAAHGIKWHWPTHYGNSARAGQPCRLDDPPPRPGDFGPIVIEPPSAPAPEIVEPAILIPTAIADEMPF